ncbi:uncharacterized protein BN809_01159 [Clostridium sp. CAG:914]|nr:uncharacterized protein BN809_01159 [Clostridium sp. CAG:914]
MDEENQTYTIDDYIADGIDKIYETINNVDVKLDDNFNDLKEEIDKLNTEVNNLVTSLRETTIVTEAKQNIMISQMEFDKRYQYRDNVRNKILGIIQSLDINVIKKSTIENLRDDSLINNHNYWLSSSLVSLCSWYTNNKEMAYIALESAIKYNDQKTSLLFSLIHLYAKKHDGAIKWFDRYLELQDPLKTEGIFVLVVDLITSGVLGNEGTTKFLNKIDEWTRELDKIDHIYNKQVSFWENYFSNIITNKDISISSYISDYVLEASELKDKLILSKCYSEFIQKFKNIYDKKNYDVISFEKKIEKIIGNLIYDYDYDEYELKKDIIKNKLIVNENGNVEEALKKFENNNSVILNEVDDLYTIITNIALNETKNNYLITINTRKVCLGLCKRYILTGYSNVIKKYFNNKELNFTIMIDDWTGITKNGSNEKELQTYLEEFYLNKNKQNLKEDKLFNREMLIAIIIGLIGIIISYKIPILSIIILLSTIIFCICQMYIINKKNSEKKEKVNIMIQENKKLLNKIIIEIVDFCLMYNENNINIDDFSDYINKYNPNDFIITNSNERNIIIDRKEI